MVVMLLMAASSSSNGGGLNEQVEMLELSELLWSLCEILLIDIVPGLFALSLFLLQCFDAVYLHNSTNNE